MDKKVLNYRILIEKEKTEDGFVYVSYVPSLGISDFGKTIEETVKNTEKAITLYLDTLIDLDKEIPQTDSEEFFVLNKKFNFPKPIAFA